jgi:hypothetical protein
MWDGVGEIDRIGVGEVNAGAGARFGVIAGVGT